MKRIPKHDPIIDYNRARCSCARWNGPKREYGESVGAFTYRAHEDHKRHAAAPAVQQVLDIEPQMSMFA